jgi:mannose-6-phosphate isomerase
MRPIRLPPNQLWRFYRGGSAIARFRGTRSDEQHAPEDWVGSTTTVFGESRRGLSVLPEGRLLREAIAADPEDFLGPEHVADFGADPKLLDGGERLPVHFHPDRAFAAEHLGLLHGKTEVWMIVEARDDACVYLGFREQIGAEALAGWVGSTGRRADAGGLEPAEGVAG